MTVLCGFIDHITSSKAHIKQLRERGFEQAIVHQLRDYQGVIQLSTCLRFELYIDSEGNTAAVRNQLAVAGMRVLQDPVSILERIACVSSGVESEIIGERQISQQLVRSIDAARSRGTLTSALEQLSGQGLQLGAQARERYEFFNPISYASIAAQILTRKITRGLLIVGCGDMAQEFVRHTNSLLHDNCTFNIFLANRTVSRAEYFKAYEQLPPWCFIIQLEEVNDILPYIDTLYIAAGGTISLDVARITDHITAVDVCFPPTISEVSFSNLEMITLYSDVFNQAITMYNRVMMGKYDHIADFIRQQVASSCKMSMYAGMEKIP